MRRNGIFKAFIAIALLAVMIAGGAYAYQELDTKTKRVLDDTKETLEIEYHPGSSANNVTNAVTLPLTLNGVPVVWKSSDPTILDVEDNKGVIKTTDTNKSVILTAIIKKNGQTVYKSFELTIKNDQYLISFEGYDHFNFFIAKNGTLVLPEEPAKEGYNFEHWSTEEGGEAIDTTQPINSNTNLYPVFAARTDIPYKVLHYYETLDGSFVLENTENLTGTTNSVVTANASITPGYVKSNHLNSKESGAIAADGSLVLKVYYSRQRYRLSFNLGLGEGNFPDLFIKHDAPISKPSNVPVATGRHFVRWSAEPNGQPFDFSVTKMTQDLVLYAVYDLNLYTVNFYNDDLLVHTEQVFYGDNATLPLVTPTKEGYDFIGWNHNLQNISENTNVSALFKIKSYQIKFYVNSEVISEVTAEHFSSVTPPQAPEITGWNFVKWDLETNNISGHMSVSAVYVRQQFTVKYYNHLGIVIKEEIVSYEGEVTPPQPPVKPNTQEFSYTFTGWSALSDIVKTNLDIYPEYQETKNEYTYRFILAGEINALKELTVPYGTEIIAPATPTKDSTAQYHYSFNGFQGFTVGMTLTDNVTFVGSFTSILRSYEVTYIVEGETHSTETVNYGSAANPPTVTKENTISHVYVFSNWDVDLSNITGTTVATAQFAEYDRTYVIKFTDHDGTLLDERSWDFGTTPSYQGVLTRDPDIDATYEFAGWSPAINQVNSNVTYQAVYNRIINKYDVIFMQDGTQLYLDRVEHGKSAYYNVVPTKASTPEFDYVFAGWDKDFNVVTGDMTVNAIFTPVTRQYTFEFKSNGTILSYGSVNYNTTIPAEKIPADPNNKLNYHFVKWVIGGNEYTTDMPILENILIEAYFEIDRFTIVFENEGDVELQTISNIAYGETPAYTGDTPTKASTDEFDYVFAGWNPAVTQVTGDKTYVATFNAFRRSYLITFKLDADNTHQTLTVLYGETPEPTNPTKASTAEFNYVFSSWSPALSPVTGAKEYVAQFSEDKRSYDITFNVDGELTVSSFEYGSYPSYGLVDPTKASSKSTNYAFAGWSLTATGEVITLPVVEGEKTYYAIFTESVRHYDATWVVSGQLDQVTSHPYGEAFSDTSVYKEKATDPNKYTFTFAGWSLSDGGDIITLPTVASNQTFYAIFTATPINHYLTYKVDGVQHGEVETHPYNGNITPRENPTKTGYTFSGWDNVPTTMPANDVEVNGTFTINSYTLTIVLANGEDNILITQNYGTDITAPANPTKTGYTFTNWSEAIPVTMPAEDKTITAEYLINNYSLTYQVDGVQYGEVEHYDYNAEITPRAVPTKTGYTFSGWDFVPTNMPDNDVIVSGTFTINQYTISFDTNGGTTIDPITQDYGTAIVAPADPTRVGYTFAGWNAPIPATMPAENKTITAEWTIITYTITYNLSGGSHLGNPNSYQVTTPTIILADATKAGYSFFGWYDNTDTKVTEIQLGSTGDVTLTAKFEIINYTISYIFNGGAATNPTIYTIETPTFTLNPATKEGYTFNGWFNESNELVTEITLGSTENITLTAKFTVNVYNIKFQLDNGDGYIQVFKDYGKPVEAPTGFTKVGHYFVEWDQIVPSTMPAQNMVITAIWARNEYTITYIHPDLTETTETVLYHDLATNPGYIPEDGYTQGWYLEEVGNITPFDFLTPIEGDITIKYFENVTIDKAFENAENELNANLSLDAWMKDYNGSREKYADYDINVDNHEIIIKVIDKSVLLVEVLSGESDPEKGFNNLIQLLLSGIGELAPGINSILEAVKKSGAKYFNIPIDKDNPGYKVLLDFGGNTLGGKLTGEKLNITEEEMTLNVIAAVFAKTFANLSENEYFKDSDGNPVKPDESHLFELLLANFEIMLIGNYPINLYGDINGEKVYIGSLETKFEQVYVDLTTNIIANPEIDNIESLVTLDQASIQINPESENETGFDVKITQLGLLSNLTQVESYGYYRFNINTPDGYKLKTFTIDGVNEPLDFPQFGDYLFIIKSDSVITIEFVKEFNVKFFVDGVQYGQPQRVEYGDAAELPTPPTKPGFTFVKWDHQVAVVIKDINANAVWEELASYTVTFKDMDGTVLKTPEIVYEGGYATAPIDPSQVGHTFTGWDKSFDNITSDLVVTATYSVNQYQVTFKVPGLSDVVKTINYGQPVVAPEVAPKEGHDFAWTDQVPATMPAQNLIINGAYTVKQYTITYMVDGVEDGSIEQYNYGAPISIRPEPTKVGHNFSGWSRTLPATMPAENIVVSGAFTINQYTLTFKVDGEENVVLTQDYGTAVTAPVEITKVGHTFDKWEPVVPATMPATNMTITAQWTINQYTITFDSDGGTAVNPITQDYGSTITPPANPTKEGHTFDGWSPELPATMPATNMTITAQWTVNQYTITFVLDNGDTNVVLTQDYGTAVTAPVEITKVGHTFDKWEPAVPATMPAENITVKAIWIVNEYTIILEPHGGTLDQTTITAEYGVEIVLPKPSKAGETFRGWFRDDGVFENQFLLETMPAEENLTLYAAYTEWPVITLNLAGGILNITSITQAPGTTITPPANPTRVGYTFDKWEPVVPATMPAEDMEVIAIWTINQYTITFDSDGGTAVNPITQDYGSTITPPANPTKEGHTFDGWNPIVPATMPADNMTVKAIWTVNEYKITYQVDGDTYGEIETYEYNALITPRPEPTKEGYRFSGWEQAIPTNMPANNLVITGTFTINQYTITFILDNGEENVVLTQDYGTAVTAPVEITKVGHTFDKWEPVVPATMPATNMTITAQWTINQYTITFDSDGGTAVNPITQDYGSTITPPANPTKEGHTFDGWNPIVPATMPADNMTVKAIWTVNEYKITYQVDGDTYGEIETYEYNALITPRPEPMKEGYRFSGWEQAIPTNMPANNLVITGTFTINQYTITFILDNGEENVVLTQDYGTAVTAPVEITKVGHTFDKWEPVVPATMPATNMTITAQWTINQYTITFDSDGGTAVNPITQDYGSTITPPANPTKEGHTFDGWNPIVPATMPADNMTVKAIWTVNEYKITYQVDGDTYGEIETYEYNALITPRPEPMKEGYTFSGWEQAIPTNMPANNLVITGTFTINQYTITFILDNGEENVVLTQDYGTAVTAPVEITKVGHTFDKWEPVVPATMPATNMTITAQWKVNKYIITINTDGGPTIAPIRQDYGSEITPLEDPTKVGYTFDKWEPAIPATMPAEDMIVKAIWTVNQYTITFDTDGGNLIEAITQDYNSAIIRPANPVKEGYTFTKWSQPVPTTMPAENITITALWTINQYTISFDSDGGTAVDPITQNFNSAITAPVAPTKVGYTFSGWNPALPTIMPAEDMELVAIWAINSYQLIYTIDDVTSSKDINFGEAVTLESPSKVGYTFDGWSPELPATMLANDLEVTAQFSVITYQITYHLDEGNHSGNPEVYTIETDDIVLKPASKEGYEFLGWFPVPNAGDEIIVIDKGSHGDLDLYAKYQIKSFTITYKVDNEIVGEIETYPYQTPITIREEPQKVGYTFSGWDQVLPDLMPANNLVVNGSFVQNKYLVEFLDINEQRIGEVIEVIHGQPVLAPEAPEVVGYTFDKWNQDLSSVTNDLTVKALYTINEYEVKFLGHEGVQIGQTQMIKYNEGAVAPMPPEVEGMTFVKWDQSFDNVKNDLVINSIYKFRTYTVEFRDFNNEPLGEIQVIEYNKHALEPEIPNVEGYNFIRWSEEFTRVKQDLIIKAIYEVKVYSVKFLDFGGQQIGDTQMISHNQAAIAPEVPLIVGYRFIKWSTEFINVVDNLLVQAQYEQITFEVKFLDKNGQPIGDVQVINYGGSATAPTPPVVENFTFIRWSHDFREVKANLSIEAIYQVNIKLDTVFKEFNELKLQINKIKVLDKKLTELPNNEYYMDTEVLQALKEELAQVEGLFESGNLTDDDIIELSDKIEKLAQDLENNKLKGEAPIVPEKPADQPKRNTTLVVVLVAAAILLVAGGVIALFRPKGRRR